MDVPANRVHYILGKRERQGSVVLAREELCRPVAFAFLDRSVDDELRWDVANSVFGDGIDFPASESQPGRQVEEQIPLRVHVEDAVEQAIAILFGVPIGVPLRDPLRRYIGHRRETSAFPHEPEHRAHQRKPVVH
jgi:hypothetical protein